MTELLETSTGLDPACWKIDQLPRIAVVVTTAKTMHTRRPRGPEMSPIPIRLAPTGGGATRR
jgi:hypothetical protein